VGNRNNSPISFIPRLQDIILFLFIYGTISAYSTNLKIKEELSLHPMDMEAFACA